MNDSDGCVVNVEPAAVPTALVNETSDTDPPIMGTLPCTVREVPFSVAVNVNV